jgi:hypothetical protein
VARLERRQQRHWRQLLRADLYPTAEGVGERDGWDSPLYLAISRDIAKWEKRRARILRTLEKYAA